MTLHPSAQQQPAVVTTLTRIVAGASAEGRRIVPISADNLCLKCSGGGSLPVFSIDRNMGALCLRMILPTQIEASANQKMADGSRRPA